MRADPFEFGIARFGEDLRAGRVSVESAVSYFLERINQYNDALSAYQCVNTEAALTSAKALDLLLASGHDAGPLMGVPIAVKDIISVDGLPVTNGSLHPSAHLNGGEGTLIRRLRSLGCVILGKTKTVEFALGATGVNEARGTPQNPWDMHTHRLPGGSSSGSAVALAAGLCAFALGTDTGGSIRIPACYNGLFGHKTSMGLWPTDGVFPLSPTLDSVGPLCRTAEDAALIHEVLHHDEVVPPKSLAGLRLAKPTPLFFDELDEPVAACFDAALLKLTQAGVEIVDLHLPESLERNQVFPPIVGAEIIATLGVDEFAAARSKMDTVTAARAAIGLETSAVDYLLAKRRHRELTKIAAETFVHVDAWVAPTVPMLPMPLADLQDDEKARRALLSSRNTQPGNLYGLCACSLPIQQLSSSQSMLPVGFQLMMPSNSDAKLLGMALAIEEIIGQGPRPDMALRT